MPLFSPDVRRRRWDEALPVATARIQKDLKSVQRDLRVPLEEFLSAHASLVELLFLDRNLLAPPPERITAYSVRFAQLTLNLASMGRSLAKAPDLRSQLSGVFAPLFDEPEDAVQRRLEELGETASGISSQELWEVAGRTYTIIKRGVLGGDPRIEPQELRMMEQKFQQCHEHAVRNIARRLASDVPPPTKA